MGNTENAGVSKPRIMEEELVLREYGQKGTHVEGPQTSLQIAEGKEGYREETPSVRMHVQQQRHRELRAATIKSNHDSSHSSISTPNSRQDWLLRTR